MIVYMRPRKFPTEQNENFDRGQKKILELHGEPGEGQKRENIRSRNSL